MPSNPTSETPDQTQPRAEVHLTSLAPRFDEEHHQLYYDLLVDAIDADDNRNVALTGAYGTGKSSILDKLRKDRSNRVVELSLSTIASEPTSSGGDLGPTGATSRTNQIQKEIVKQLLYRLHTTEVPRSRFRRASAPDRAHEWRVAAVWGAIAFCVLMALGVVQPLVSTFAEWWRQLLIYGLLAAGMISVAWVVGELVRGRPSVAASMSAGPATVTLSKSSQSYFDEYLDEIVYFFQVSQRDIVLVEDVDRFDDVQVFDTLRALNGLLNSSDQVGRRIVFVYAIRDSVFELIGSKEESSFPRGTGKKLPAIPDRAKATLERASRTKFFDMIIPVVAFVSADNARDLMSRAMKSEHFVIDPALIRLAARHVADMRLIHNIRNEFEVYRRQLIDPVDHIPGITDDLVFAMVLFKNTHLADFEKIRHQASTLDTLYSSWRRLVSHNLAKDAKRLAQLRSSRQIAEMAAARAASAGRLLSSFSDALAQAAGAASGRRAQAELAGAATKENVSDPATWLAIANGQAQQITVSDGYRSAVSLSFSPELLSKVLRTPLDPAEWNTSNARRVAADIAAVEERLGFLRHHTWTQLCNRPDITVTTPSPNMEKETDGEPSLVERTFDDLVEDTLESDLARDLVRHGFVTSHFALYTSSYYGEHLSRDATEYIRRCIEPGIPDATFRLKKIEVLQILREQGAQESDEADLFNDPSVYNISILDYLLTSRQGAARMVARRLSSLGSTEREFIDAYIAQGKHPDALLAAMTPSWRGVLTYSVATAQADQRSKLRLVDAVLRALPDADYEVDEGVRRLFETSYRSLKGITRPGSAERARIVLQTVDRSGATLESLKPLSSEGRNVAIELRLYPITEENLRAVTPAKSIALDVLRKDPRVYGYVLGSLADYFTAFEESGTTTYTVEDPATFTAVLTEVAAALDLTDATDATDATGATRATDATLLGKIIESANVGCRVESLASVPSGAWPYLVASGRTDPSFSNTHAYIDQYGVDEHLAILLASHDAITGTADQPEADRLKTAVAILAATAQIPALETRVRLTLSLRPLKIPPADIVAESGPLVARLLEEGLVEDDSDAFSSRLMLDWATYEATIQASESFSSFVSPELLFASQIPSLLRSQGLSTDVKKLVVNKLADYLADASRGQAEAIAVALNDAGWKIHFERIETLRVVGVSNGELVKLVASDEGVTVDEVKELFRGMGKPYSTVADRGRGRPSFPNDPAHRKVLERLVGSTISKVEPEEFKFKGSRLVTPLLYAEA